MGDPRPLWQVNLFVTDLEATRRFYEGLEWTLDQLGPIDAFWGSRYAVVVDPDGNRIGLKSPVDDALRSPPP